MCLLNCHVQTGPTVSIEQQIVNLHIWVQLYSLKRLTALPKKKLKMASEVENRCQMIESKR